MFCARHTLLLYITALLRIFHHIGILATGRSKRRGLSKLSWQSLLALLGNVVHYGGHLSIDSIIAVVAT